MKRILVTAFLAPVLLSACSRRTHASTDNSWSLSLSKAGKTPRSVRTYRWKEQTRLSCRLKVRATSKQVEVPRDVTMVLSLKLVDEGQNRSVLNLRIEDLITGTGNRPALWTNPVAFDWVVTKRGRTLSLNQDSESMPVVLSGLPDMQLLLSRMVPTFPAQKIGPGAAWSKRSNWSLTIPGPTGTGTVEARDRINYELVDGDAGNIVVEEKGSTRYQGSMHPVGHMLVVRGRGTFSTKAQLQGPLFTKASMKAEETISLNTDGKKRTIQTRYEALLDCTRPGAASSLEHHHRGQLSQRFVSPKAMAGEHRSHP